MSGRLEVGCLALVLTRPEDRKFDGGLFGGVRGTLVEGPYPGDLSAECWTMEGPEVMARAEAHGVLNPSPALRNVPASRLIRIDDPDVKLTDGQDIPRAMPRDVMA